MIRIRINESALKHGIAELSIREVLADTRTTKAYQIHDDAKGNPQEMLIGYTVQGVLLEIAVRYTENFDEVFHANRVSAKFRKLYKEK